MTPNATINVSVSNQYREPSYSSEVITQGILGEKVEILETEPSFSKVRQADGYESWISAGQIVSGHQLAGDDIMVRSHFLRIYAEPATSAEGIKDAVIGSTLKAIDEVGAWYQIALPDGSTGWAEKRYFGIFPAYSADNIVTLAREFLGYQYSWGGCTPKGFDCSGFVQTVFRLTGCLLFRDSWQQQQHNLFSTDYHAAQPADLLFFGASPDKVTHVAISLGHERFINAKGWVRLNSFKETDSDFSRDLLNTFISVNRYSA
ncbi:MAG: NlpC/P60 family protein [Desulfuromusa sp.]|nr:NlpC/P60 family protein [Desulfuromusa sp.]